MTASLNPFSDLSKLGQNQTEGSETVSECASGALPTAIGSSHLPSVPANGSPEPSPATAPNPFNLKSMYLSQARAVTIKPVLTIVPVRRANRHTYFRTHPDPAYRTDGCIGLFKIQDGSDDNVYICSPEIAFELGDEVKSYMLYTAITSLKTVFIWPLQMPDADDRWHEAHSSTMDGLEASMHTWLKLVYNRELGAYTQKFAEGDLGEPTWPTESFESLVDKAFRRRSIQSMDHPLLRRLRGEI